MKFALLAILTLISTTTLAKSFKAHVLNYQCLEIDPFLLGKVCLLNLETSKNNNLSLVFSYDQAILNEGLNNSEMLGMTVSIDKTKLKKITNSQKLNELKSYDQNYYYMYADPDAVSITFSSDSAKEMQTLAKLKPIFSKNNLPIGYKAFLIKKPRITANLKIWLNEKTRSMELVWKDYVLNSDEFYNQTNTDLVEISQNASSYLEVDYLLEINKVYKLTKNNIFIGYFYEITNWIESAIIQDGSWYEAYLTTDQKIIKITEETN